MKMLTALLGALGRRGGPKGARSAKAPTKNLTPEEAKARRKAYKKRKAAKAARRRNRK